MALGPFPVYSSPWCQPGPRPAPYGNQQVAPLPRAATALHCGKEQGQMSRDLSPVPLLLARCPGAAHPGQGSPDCPQPFPSDPAFQEKPGFPRIHVMGVWNSSRQTVQEMTPVLRARSLEQEEGEGLVSRGACVSR